MTHRQVRAHTTSSKDATHAHNTHCDHHPCHTTQGTWTTHLPMHNEHTRWTSAMVSVGRTGTSTFMPAGDLTHTFKRPKSAPLSGPKSSSRNNPSTPGYTAPRGNRVSNPAGKWPPLLTRVSAEHTRAQTPTFTNEHHNPLNQFHGARLEQLDLPKHPTHRPRRSGFCGPLHCLPEPPATFLTRLEGEQTRAGGALGSTNPCSRACACCLLEGWGTNRITQVTIKTHNCLTQHTTTSQTHGYHHRRQ